MSIGGPVLGIFYFRFSIFDLFVCRPLLKTRLGTAKQAHLLLTGECQQAVNFGRLVTDAGIGRDVQQSVGRQDTVPARASSPVIERILAGVDVEELYAATPRQDIVRGGFIAVTPVVVLGPERLFRGELFSYLAGFGIESHQAVIRLGHGPRETVDDKHAVRSAVVPGAAVIAPEFSSGLGGECDELAFHRFVPGQNPLIILLGHDLAEQQDVLVSDQRGKVADV